MSLAIRRLGGALVVLPMVVTLSGCRFDLPEGVPSFDRGELPHNDAIFCNIEFGRRCATPTEKQMGINLANQYEEGFWAKKSSLWGLDYSPDALAACGGEPQTVVYRGPFPEGNPICLNGQQFDIGKFPSIKGACEAWCNSHGWIDGDDNHYRCDNIAWPATGSWSTPVVNACTVAGTLRADFQDLRRQRPREVVWTSASNVMITGNSIRRTNGGTLPNSGATSVRLLASGNDGFVDFVAIETNRNRLCGLSIGPNPDGDQQAGDIDFAFYLASNGMVSVYESGVQKSTAFPYSTLDRFRVAVIGGVVQYFVNDTLVLTSPTALGFPMRVDTALLQQDATITNVKTSF